jgi:PAS domain S-box-containing protein
MRRAKITKKPWHSTTLSQQGLILIAVPLLFEFAFVGSLAYLLERADGEIQQEEHAREVLLHAYAVNRLSLDATSFLGEYTLSGQRASKSAYQAKLYQTRNEYRILEDLVRNEPEQLALAENSKQLAEQQVVALEEMYDAWVSQGNLGALKKMAMMRHLRTRASAYLDQVLEHYLAIQKSSPAMRENTRVQIRVVLIGGFLFSLIVAVALARHFSNRTVKRLGVLMENSRNLASGGALLPPLDGDDEIAQLDRVFTEMAGALAQAMRKEREAAAYAQNSESKVRSILENLPVGVLTVRSNGSIDFSNAVMQKMLETDSSSLTDRSLPSIFIATAPGAGAEQSDFMSSLSMTIGTVSERQIARANGEPVPVEMTVAQLNMLESSQFLIMMIDITERLEVLRLKRDFVAMVSHELRTPLTSVQTFLGSLSAGTYGDVSERLERKLLIAERNVGRLMELINNLLDFEKLEAKEIAPAEDGVAVGDVVGAAIDSVSDFAEKQHIALESNGICSDRKILADRDLIVQVLVNLLGNAVKFSPAESTVKVTAEDFADSVKFQVIDSGRGVPDKFQQRIFERFEQVSSADATEKGGSGLGLAICKTIVTKHGGTIGVESKDGSGSTFWFVIPQVASKGQQPTTGVTSNGAV